MQRGVWTFVLLLLTAIVCVSAVPPTDLPETSYNEVDTPVNQAPPVVLGIRFVRPAKLAVVVPKRTLIAEWHLDTAADEFMLAPLPTRYNSHAIQDLLCTLLI